MVAQRRYQPLFQIASTKKTLKGGWKSLQGQVSGLQTGPWYLTRGPGAKKKPPHDCGAGAKGMLFSREEKARAVLTLATSQHTSLP